MSPYAPLYVVGGLLLWGLALSYGSMLCDWLKERRRRD
jgi:hypothetical protein